MFVYVELSTVLTRGIEQASTETKARGEHEVTYHTDTTAAPKRRGCSALPVGCCMWVITFTKVWPFDGENIIVTVQGQASDREESKSLKCLRFQTRCYEEYDAH